jgi:hypothetical protein
MAHEHYEATARCLDLPELMDRIGDEVALSFPSGDYARVVEAVAARRTPGAALQAKVDGCWCAVRLDESGRVKSVTSRTGRPLRCAFGWVGEKVKHQLPGWTLIGEVEAGTTWSSRRRTREAARASDADARALVRVPRLHLYAAYDRQGRRVAEARLRSLPAWIGHPRIVAVRQCGPREDWSAFARSVLERGGEGVVIRAADGGLWRAKTRVTLDRVVVDTEYLRDHLGVRRLHVRLAYVRDDGVPVETQQVLAPEGARPEDLDGRVVAVTGASVDLVSGVVRHARIVEIREPGDKPIEDCRLAA